jgi:predicted phosphodiesterase
MDQLNTTVLIIGDHHGNYSGVLHKINKHNIKDCLLIHVGDGGEGFKSRERELETFNILNAEFESLGIEYISIRGNHSDPAYFDGSINLSHFKLLPDYSRRIINGEEFLFVGGAVSIDRAWRKEGLSYWSDEGFVLNPELVEKCDVLITHSAPSWIGPFDKEGISGWCEKDPTLWDLCYKERIEHSELIKLCQPSKAYHGHFHESHRVDFAECYSTILAIEEIKEHRKA